MAQQQQPPGWAPKAIATPQGWVDPITGELLMAIEGLKVTVPAPVTE